jgi:hypothetical protein
MKHAFRIGESEAAKVEFTFMIESLDYVPAKFKNFPMRIEWKRTSDSGKVYCNFLLLITHFKRQIKLCVIQKGK